MMPPLTIAEPTTPEQWRKTVQAAFVVALLTLGQGEPLSTLQAPTTLTEGEWTAVLEAARRQAGMGRSAAGREPESR